jgi:regulator of RNase E activity RraA
MTRKLVVSFLLAALAIVSLPFFAEAQITSITKEKLIRLTPNWKGERFPDGRPKVPDYVLEKIKDVSFEEALNACTRARYNTVFEKFENGNWKIMHPGTPLVGRAVTEMFIPGRSEFETVIVEDGTKEGKRGESRTWLVTQMVEGDVLVVGCFGKIGSASLVGDNYAATMIGLAGPGRGVIMDSSLHDSEIIDKFPNTNFVYRDWDITYASNVSLLGINIPTLIGKSTVMPGDVVYVDPRGRGMLFIPPQIAQQLADRGPQISDLETKYMNDSLMAKKYPMLEVHGDGAIKPHVMEDFRQWLRDNKSKFPEYAKAIDDYLARPAR